MTTRIKTIKILLTVLILLIFSACGGGGGGSTTSGTSSANNSNSSSGSFEIVEVTLSVTGPNSLVMDEGSSVQLVGSATTDSTKPISYYWEIPENAAQYLSFSSPNSPSTQAIAADVDGDKQILVLFSAITDDFNVPATHLFTITIKDLDTPSPTATPSPTPIATPVPTPTPSPSPTPTPTPTPEPEYPAGPFKVEYYEEADGSDSNPGHGDYSQTSGVVPRLVATDTVDAVTVNSAAVTELEIEDDSFYGVWQGDLVIAESKTELNAVFDVSQGDVIFELDDMLIARWGGESRTLPLTLEQGTHTIRVEYHNHWFTTNFALAIRENSAPPAAIPNQYPAGPFKVSYYFEDDGTDPSSGTDGSDPLIVPVFKGEDARARDIGIDYIYSGVLDIDSYNFFGVWEGPIEITGESKIINANFEDISHADLSLYVDDVLIEAWANQSKTIPLDLAPGTHTVRVEYHNHWHTTQFRVNFTEQ